MDSLATADAVAGKLEEIYQHIGVPTRLRDLGISNEDLVGIARETVKNFNFNAGKSNLLSMFKPKSLWPQVSLTISMALGCLMLMALAVAKRA